MPTVRQALELALRHHQAGRFDLAEPLYRQVLLAVPEHPYALHLLGVLYAQQSQYELAKQYVSRAVAAHPAEATFHNSLGNVLKGQGRLVEAAACYQRALAMDPAMAEAHNNLGAVLKQQARLDEAAACCRQALQIWPDYADAHNNLGTVLQAQRKLDEAAACYRRALELDPHQAEFHYNLATVFSEQGRLEEAAAAYRQALQRNPRSLEALNNLGSVLLQQGNLDEAENCYQRALQYDPQCKETHNNLGNLRQQQGKPDEAIASYRRALELDPNSAEVHNNLAHCYLAAGDFARGWVEYRWRWRTQQALAGTARRSASRHWDGSPLEGKTILVSGEQGIGDTLQFVRYTRLLKQQGATVILEVQRVLHRLLEQVPWIDRIMEPQVQPPDSDYHVPLLSLPRVFGTTLQSVPAEVPYLFAKEELVRRWRGRLAEIQCLKIGIAWQGNRQYRDDSRRSVPLRAFAPIARVGGVHLVSLQKGDGLEQVGEVADQFTVTTFDGLDEDSGPLMDTAALMKGLDLVISSDTAVPHLAGALGVPVWLALAQPCDWRWLTVREDSPWYPTMRLFRQPARGQWCAVFDRLADEVRQLASRVPQKREPTQGD